MTKSHAVRVARQKYSAGMGVILILLLALSGCRAAEAAPPGLAAVAQTAPAPLSLELRSIALIPGSAVDQHGKTFNVEGVSGVTWLDGNRYAAVLDNNDKLITFTLEVEDDGRVRKLELGPGLTLAQRHDHEGIAFNWITGQSCFISDEASRTPPPGDLPLVREYRLSDGALLSTLSTPEVFAQRRINRGFESLSASPDMNCIWTANEEALAVDGPASTRKLPTMVRLLRFNRIGDTYAPGPQFAYPIEPIHAPAGDRRGDGYRQSCSGLCDLVVLADGRLLALERSFAFNGLLSSLQTRIFEVDVTQANNVSSFASLKGQRFTPASKRLLHKGDLANLEGLCLGPQLAGGGRLLVGVADNNGLLANTMVTFELRGAP